MNILHPLRVWQLFLFLAVGDTLWAYFIMFYQNLKAKALGHKTRAVVGSTEISLSGNLLWWQVNFKIVQAAFLAVAEVSN